MKNVVVWIDSRSAHIFELAPTGIVKEIIKKNTSYHHTRHKNDIHRDSHLEDYYKQLKQRIADADQVLLLGPGLAKNQFNVYMRTHSKNILNNKVVGLLKIESTEHKTEKQMLAKVRKFFKSHNLFANPI